MVKIKSDILKAMVDKVSKGTEQVDIHIVSNYVFIEAKDGNLTLSTTDNTHVMKITAKSVVEQDETFYAGVPNQLFCRLVAKLNAPEIQMSLRGNITLEIKSGNSDYSIPLFIDPNSETGELYKMEEISFDTTEETINFSTTLEQLKNVLNYNATSTVNRDRVAAIMANYYIDSKGVYTYDGTFCENKIALCEGLQALLPLKFVSLCQVFDATEIKFSLNKDRIRVVAGNDQLIYKLSTDKFNIAEYPIGKLRGLINNAYSSFVCVAKTELLDALDRLSLFNKEDKAVVVPIKLMFDEGKLTIYDARNKNIDIIKFSEASNVQKYEAILSLTVLRNLLTCHSNDKLKLCYDVNNHIGLKISDDAINQLIPYIIEQA